MVKLYESYNKQSKTKEVKKLRVIVCGGRNFQDREFCFRKLDEIIGKLDNVEIVSGHSKGADRFGEEYAIENSLKVSVFKADWKRYENLLCMDWNI